MIFVITEFLCFLSHTHCAFNHRKVESALGVKDPLEIFQSTLLALEHVYVCLSCQWGKNSNEILVFIHLGAGKSWLNIPIWSWEHLCGNESFFLLIEICTWEITTHKKN